MKKYVYFTLDDVGGNTLGIMDLTPEKRYEFTPDDSSDKGGHIKDDNGYMIYIMTNISQYTCAFLCERAAWRLESNPNNPQS